MEKDCNRLIKEAKASNIESVREANIDVDPLKNQTIPFIAINITAVATEAKPANITSVL